MAKITSNLWISSQLVNNSTFFPALVRSAAQFLGKEYSEDLLWFVAQRTEVLGAIQLNLNEPVDVALSELISTDEATGAAVDSVITTAVNSYNPE